MSERDYNILEHMLGYCDRISAAIKFFGDDFGVFSENLIYQDAVCMSILQIGELAGHLSHPFVAENPSIPWRDIRDTRNFMAHGYGKMSPRRVWRTTKDSIPQLQQFCSAAITQETIARQVQETLEPDNELEL